MCGQKERFSVVYRSQMSRSGSCFVSFRHQELSFLNCEIVTTSQKLCKNLDLFTNTILKLLWSDRKYVAKVELGSSLISLHAGNTRALHSGAIYNFLSCDLLQCTELGFKSFLSGRLLYISKSHFCKVATVMGLRTPNEAFFHWNT